MQKRRTYHLTEEKNTQWHPAFTAAIHMEFRENKSDLDFQSEVPLNTMPLRVDMILIKKKHDVIIKNELGRIFQQFNLLEYKSPKDELNYDVFLKGIAYAYLFKSSEAHIDDIPLYEVTLSFIREYVPIKLFKKLKELNLSVEEISPGIYYISRLGELSIQIIITSRLDEKLHIWLNALTSHISRQHAQTLVNTTKTLTDLDDKNYAESVWEVVAKENATLIKILKEDTLMYKALAEIMKPEIDKAIEEAADKAFDDGFNDGQLTQLFRLLKKGIITLEEAVQETKLSLEEFQQKYNEYSA